MFTDLPNKIQQQILQFLETDNFLAAKELRDLWLQANKQHRTEEISES